MSEKIVQLNEEVIKGQLKELVRGSVEETLNELLEKVPTWTQAELQALSDQQLNEELYFIIDLSDSGWDSNTLSKYSREVISTILAQHPQFAYGSFRSSEKLRNGRQRIELQPGNYPDKKTCAYVWVVLIGYWAMKEEARKIG